MSGKVRGIYGLFIESFSAWDVVSDQDIQVYDAVLKIDIGHFKAGDAVDVFALLLMDTDTCKLKICQGSNSYEADINFDISFVNFKEIK